MSRSGTSGTDFCGFGPGLFRLFLASVVVIHHSFPFRAGSWAVYVFFILSGYWITKMWQSRYVRTQNSYITFLISRWWRLAPVFLICSLLGLLSAALLQDPLAPAVLVNPVWWLRQLPIAGSTYGARILAPSWSLDVEMQFYLVAPIAIFLSGRAADKVRWLIVASLVAILGVLFWFGFLPETPYFAAFCGFFLAGIALALTDWVARTSSVIGGMALLSIGLLVLLASPVTRTGIWYEGSENVAAGNWVNIWWALAAVLVIPFVSRNVRVRSSSFDRFLGNLAYPLYLFHWIPRQWYYHFCETNDHGVTRVFFLLGNFIFAFGGAILILVLIDQPLDRWRAKWLASRERRSQINTVGQPSSIAASAIARTESHPT
jgi:peptidoglycan/LPS O-acetylase OafA/YrhL